MDFCPLTLQCIDVRLKITNLTLQILNLVRVGSNGLVESLQEEVWSWLMLD